MSSIKPAEHFHFDENDQKEDVEEEMSRNEELFLRSEEKMSQICQEFVKNDQSVYSEEKDFDKDNQDLLYYGESSGVVCLEMIRNLLGLPIG